MNNGTPHQLEQFADGRYDVLAENVMRAGAIIGAKDHYCAEAGRKSIGRYPSKKQAANAVLEHAGITGLVQQMSAILAQKNNTTIAHRNDFTMFDTGDIEEWKCATNLLWVIHRAGTSLVHLDLPLSERQALAVLDAFTPGPQQSGWALYLVNVDNLKVTPLTEGGARNLVRATPRYKFDGTKIVSYGRVIADVEVKKESSESKNKCVIQVRSTEEPDKQRIKVLAELGRQYYAVHLVGQYDGFERITVRQGQEVHRESPCNHH